jgi:hypothetical protein
MGAIGSSLSGVSTEFSILDIDRSFRTRIESSPGFKEVT